MAVTYGFFNSIDGDRKYNADQMSSYFEGLISNGVYANVGQSMAVLADTGLTVKVGSGRAVLENRWVKNDSAYAIELNPANPTLNRIDSIVVKLDSLNRQIALEVISGEASSTPVAPILPTSSSVKFLTLANILVAAGATSISQADIEDTRSNTSVCGWVTGLITQIDTSTLFLQFQTAFDEWFDDLTQELRVDTYIESYYKKVTVSGSTAPTVNLDWTEGGKTYVYDSSDIFIVTINGLMAEPGTDYTINDTGTPYMEFQTDKNGTVIEIKVLKSKIGSAPVE